MRINTNFQCTKGFCHGTFAILLLINSLIILNNYLAVNLGSTESATK